MTPHYGKRKGSSVHEKLNSAELFNLYNMLNGVKTDLLWGRNSEEQPEEIEKQKSPQPESSTSAETNNKETSNTKGHVRRPSTTSVTSSNSTITLSDTESEISNENDSGIETESNHEADKVNEKSIDKSTELARQYRTHLLGLYRCLEQMTEAANYLTARYQSDVGPV